MFQSILYNIFFIVVSLPVGPPRSFHNSLHTQLHVPSLFKKKKNETKSNQKKTNKSAGMCLHARTRTDTHQNIKDRVWFGLPLLLSIGVPAQCDFWSVVNILSVASKKLMIFSHTATGNSFLERAVTLCPPSIFHVWIFVK